MVGLTMVIDMPVTRIREFLNKVRILSDDECWEWTAGTKGRASEFRHYGLFTVGRKPQMTHRIAYWLEHKVWPDGMVLHRCGNPPCCNPAHLYIGSYQDNSDDRRLHGHMRNQHTPDVEAIRTVRSRFAAGEKLSEISRSMGLNYWRIWEWCRRGGWSEVA